MHAFMRQTSQWGQNRPQAATADKARPALRRLCAHTLHTLCAHIANALCAHTSHALCAHTPCIPHIAPPLRHVGPSVAATARKLRRPAFAHQLLRTSAKLVERACCTQTPAQYVRTHPSMRHATPRHPCVRSNLALRHRRRT